MLQIQDLTYRIEGRLLFDGASAQIADGWKVGLVGRNGTGKSTLLRIILDELDRPGGVARINRGAKVGHVAQEAAPTDETVLEVVIAADEELDSLMKESETATDPHRIAEIHERIADLDGWSAEARAGEILAGLGFTQDDLERPVKEFSGGWRMRAALAGVLFSQPDLLLLDEPTNYLDLEGAAWLETYLRKYPKTVVVVSHDRDLLNRSVTHILAIENAKLVLNPGGYDAYLKRRAERTAHLEAQKAKQDVERAHLQSFIDRFRAKASKARQAQSRVKMLERMTEITVPLAERTVPFNIPNPEALPPPILALDHADAGYIEGRPVLRDVTLRLNMEDRVAIVGANGQGKTTLVKSIAERLPLLAGTRRAAKALKVGYFSQDQLDELRAGETVLQHVQVLVPEAGQARARAIAAQFGFGAEKVETQVEKLSGGEKVRLLMGLTTWNVPHILILDEPTSHLDIDSREALIHALNGFEGAVLLITHDTFLAEATADQMWLVKDGRVSEWEGDMDDYKALVQQADRSPNKAHKSDPVTPSRPAPASSAEPKPAAKVSYKFKVQLEKAEKAIAEAQKKLELLDRDLSRPDAFDHHADAEAKLKARAEWQAKLEAAEADWIEASEAIEGA
ncbi:MAG: ABC-F family ATP-binding cassette domain-containing protein [Hyphomonadaceae bacterium]